MVVDGIPCGLFQLMPGIPASVEVTVPDESALPRPDIAVRDSLLAVLALASAPGTAGGPDRPLSGAAFSPVQHVIRTSPYAFVYAGPAASRDDFGTLFKASVAKVHKLELPAGRVVTWDRADPRNSDLGGIEPGWIISVEGPVGSNVF